MLFYFYNKILNFAIVLKLQYVFPPLNNKGVLCYWEEVQIINWWWVIIHAPLPDIFYLTKQKQMQLVYWIK